MQIMPKGDKKLSQVKTSETKSNIIVSDDKILTEGKELNPPERRSDDTIRLLSEQIRDLQRGKADKAVVKSEIKRVDGRVNNTLDDVDEVKGQLMVDKPHTCHHVGEISEMKKAIEANTETARNAQKMATLASDRGFRILMGAVSGFVLFGVATVVWAVNVSHSAEDASKKADLAMQSVHDVQEDVKKAPPPQIVITPTDYQSQSTKSTKASYKPVDEQAIDLEKILERAFTKALQGSSDDSDDLLEP
jgi:hypothetical protein